MRIFYINKRAFFLLIMMLTTSFVIEGQSSVIYKSRVSQKLQLFEKFHVLANDTTVMHGVYELYYKTHLIEKGLFNNGDKKGVWTYLNLGNVLEFQYNYDLDSLIKISGVERQQNLKNESPCLFLGSSLVPYAYISSIVGYPLEAFDKEQEGLVNLFLVISNSGEIIHRYIGDNANKILAEAVLAASYKFPESWRWLPERANNKKVSSVYKITIYFEL